MNTCGYSPYITSSLTRGWVCRLQLLLSFASAFSGPSPAGLMTIFYFLRFETPPTWKARSPYLRISPRIWVTRFYPQALGSLFVASYNSQGYGGSIGPASTRYNQLTWTDKRSRSLLPASSRHAHTWHRAPLGPMAIYLFNVKTFVFFFFRWSSLLIKEGLVKSKSHCDWRSVNQ
jgi:hypothetical protein